MFMYMDVHWHASACKDLTLKQENRDVGGSIISHVHSMFVITVQCFMRETMFPSVNYP